MSLHATYYLLDSPESLEGHGLSYHKIEQYVDKKMKVHNYNTVNQGSAYIAKVWIVCGENYKNW